MSAPKSLQQVADETRDALIRHIGTNTAADDERREAERDARVAAALAELRGQGKLPGSTPRAAATSADELRAAFAAVCASPRGDEPRERFAALVAAAEPETAAYIRGRLDLARRRRVSPRWNREIEDESYIGAEPPAAHRARFAPALSLVAGTTPKWTPGPVLGRGFLEQVTVDGAWFAARGAELMALAPIVDVVLHRIPLDATELFDNPAWAMARSLSTVGPPVVAAQVEALCASPYLGNLRVLVLSGHQLPRSIIHLVASSPVLAGLRSVRISGGDFPSPNRVLHHVDDHVVDEYASSFAEELRARHGDRAWFGGPPDEVAAPAEAFE